MDIRNPEGDDCKGAECVFPDTASGADWDVAGFESKVDVGGNADKLCVKLQDNDGKIKAEECDAEKYAVCQLDCGTPGMCLVLVKGTTPIK